MWVAKKEIWASNQSELEKFMIERIIQRCDYNEILSEKHRTTSGFTLVNELIHLCEATEKKYKSLHTLLILIEESKDKYLSQNIKNDSIITKYFSDLQNYIIKDFKPEVLGNIDKINLQELKKIKHNLKIFKHQLEQNYFDSLKKEILKIDFKVLNSGFQTEASKLSELLDLYITYLIHKGYSVSSFYEVIMRWLQAGYRITPRSLFQNFNFNNRQMVFVHRFPGKKSPFFEDFIEILESGILKLKINHGQVVDLNIPEITNLNFSSIDYVVTYKTATLDPHSFVRTLYDEVIKQVILRKNRNTLVHFNYFFKNTYWRLCSKTAPKIQVIKLNDDPINLSGRKKTLFNTLDKFSIENGINFNKKKLPYIENKQLSNAIFFYNMALGSKSIENSFSLLWTALEAILPYRTESSDIGSIQNFVSSSLSIGALNRDLQSFSNRKLNVSRSYHLDSSLTPDSFVINQESNLTLFQRLQTTTETKGAETCAELSNYSNLLAFQYAKIGKPLSIGKIGVIKERIEVSNLSIKYQLQRIYRHRNQIVHSAEMISEYSNLWSHLEWYVGKLLFYGFMELELLKTSKDIEDCFRKLESEYKYLVSYLTKNKELKISDLSIRIIEELFKHNWLSY